MIRYLTIARAVFDDQVHSGNSAVVRVLFLFESSKDRITKATIEMLRRAKKSRRYDRVFRAMGIPDYSN